MPRRRPQRAGREILGSHRKIPNVAAEHTTRYVHGLRRTGAEMLPVIKRVMHMETSITISTPRLEYFSGRATPTLVALQPSTTAHCGGFSTSDIGSLPLRLPQPRSSSISSRPGGALRHNFDFGRSLRTVELFSSMSPISATISAAESSGLRSVGVSSPSAIMEIIGAQGTLEPSASLPDWRL